MSKTFYSKLFNVLICSHAIFLIVFLDCFDFCAAKRDAVMLEWSNQLTNQKPCQSSTPPSQERRNEQIAGTVQIPTKLYMGPVTSALTSVYIYHNHQSPVLYNLNYLPNLPYIIL